MNREYVARCVYGAVSAVLGSQQEPMSDSTIIVTIGVDSYQMIQILAEIERRMGIRMPPECAVPGDVTVGDIVRAASEAYVKPGRTEETDGQRA